MYKVSQKHKLIVTAIAALVAQFSIPMLSSVAHAAPIPGFSEVMVRFDRMEALTATGGTVCATPATAATETKVVVEMPTQPSGTDYVVNATAANWTVTTAGSDLPKVPVPSGSPATYALVQSVPWPGIGTATSVVGHNVTFPSGDLTVGTTYCFHFSATNTLTNGDVGYTHVQGQIDTYDSTPTVINESEYATSIITNDQIAVSAVVPPSFRFSLDGNSDAFTTDLQTTSDTYTSGRKFTIITNAKGGWVAWVKDSQQGLYSPSAAYTIPSVSNAGAPTALTPDGAHEGYGLIAALDTPAPGSNNCTVGIDAMYTPTTNLTTTTVAGYLGSTFAPVASCTGSAPATDNGSITKLVEVATIAGGTPAGSDYGDIITVVAAGNF